MKTAIKIMLIIAVSSMMLFGIQLYDESDAEDNIYGANDSHIYHELTVNAGFDVEGIENTTFGGSTGSAVSIDITHGLRIEKANGVNNYYLVGIPNQLGHVDYTLKLTTSSGSYGTWNTYHHISIDIIEPDEDGCYVIEMHLEPGKLGSYSSKNSSTIKESAEVYTYDNNQIASRSIYALVPYSSTYYLPTINVDGNGTFYGWQTVKNGPNIDLSAGYKPTSDCELYASFKPDFQIYMPNELQTIQAGTTFIQPLQSNASYTTFSIKNNGGLSSLSLTSDYRLQWANTITERSGLYKVTFSGSSPDYNYQAEMTVDVYVPIKLLTEDVRDGPTNTYWEVNLGVAPNSQSTPSETLVVTQSEFYRTNGATRQLIASSLDWDTTNSGVKFYGNGISTEGDYEICYTIKVASRTNPSAFNENYGSISGTVKIVFYTPDNDKEPYYSDISLSRNSNSSDEWTVTAIGVANVYKYVWEWGDGSTDTTYSNQCYHIYRTSGTVTVKLTVYNANESKQYSSVSGKQYYIGDNGSYNAFIGEQWISPMYPLGSGSYTFEQGTIPSALSPEVKEVVDGSNNRYVCITCNIPNSSSWIGKEYEYKVNTSTDHNTYTFGIFNASVQIDGNKLFKLSNVIDGYKCTFKLLMDPSQILFDSADQKDIKWTVYRTSSPETAYKIISGASEATFDLTDLGRGEYAVKVELTHEYHGGSLCWEYGSVAVPYGYELDGGDLEKQVSMTVKNVNVEPGTECRLEIIVREGLKASAIGTYISNPNLNITLLDDLNSGKQYLVCTPDTAKLYTVAIHIDFIDTNDENVAYWGETEFKIDARQDVDEEDGKEQRDIVGITNQAGYVGKTIQVVTQYQNITGIKVIDSSTGRAFNTTSIGFRLVDGAGTQDIIEITLREVGQYNVKLTMFFDDETYGITTFKVDVNNLKLVKVDKLDNIKIESGKDLIITLSKYERLRDLTFDCQLELEKKLKGEVQGLYYEKPGDGVYKVENMTLYFEDGESYAKLPTFNIIVGDVEFNEESSNDPIMLIAGAAAIILAIFVVWRFIL